MFKLRLNWLRHWIWFQPLGWCLIKYYKLKFFHSSARIITAELALTEASGWVNKVKSQLNQWEFFKRLFWGLDFIHPSQMKFSLSESCIYSFIHSPTQIAPLNIQVLKYLHKWIYVKRTWFLSLEISSGKKPSHIQVTLSIMGIILFIYSLDIAAGWTCKFCFSVA